MPSARGLASLAPFLRHWVSSLPGAPPPDPWLSPNPTHSLYPVLPILGFTFSSCSSSVSAYPIPILILSQSLTHSCVHAIDPVLISFPCLSHAHVYLIPIFIHVRVDPMLLFILCPWIFHARVYPVPMLILCPCLSSTREISHVHVYPMPVFILCPCIFHARVYSVPMYIPFPCLSCACVSLIPMFILCPCIFHACVYLIPMLIPCLC